MGSRFKREARKDDPPTMECLNGPDKPVNKLMREDHGFFEELARLINEEYEQAMD